MTASISHSTNFRFEFSTALYLILLSSPITSTGGTCPSTCTCHPDSYDSSIQSIRCESGSLHDLDLARILLALPETVISIEIIGPMDNPNEFSISEDFARFFDLQELRLVNCGLQSLGKGIFAENKYLRKLDVSSNHISHLSPDTFDGMDHLQVLDLSNNRLWMDYMATGTFAYLKDLRSLNLSNNRISYFPSNLFGDLTQLQELILDDNSPRSKDLHILNQLEQLEHLSLSGCNISYLPTVAFAPHRRLKRLNLSRNQLRTSEIPALKHALHIEELDLAYNGITEIPDHLLSIFTNLRFLNLAGNHLGVQKSNQPGLSKNTFVLTNLTRLDLSDNNFRSFDSDTLSDSLSTIRSLHLSRNQLGTTDVIHLTRDMSSLTELHLSGIGLIRLPSLLPPEFLQLKILNLSHNPFDPSIYDILPVLVHLEVLDISHCNLSSAPPHHFIHFLSKLRAFYIHDNPWHCSCDLAPLRDFLVETKTPSTCHDLRFARIRCASPAVVRGKPLTLAWLYGGCDGEPANDTNLDFLSSSQSNSQLVINSEVSILIAGVCIAVFIVIAFIIGIACSQMRPQASYRTNEDKVNLSSASGMAALNDDTSPSAVPAGGLERLF